MTHFDDPDAGRSFARYLGLTMEETGEVRPGTATVRGTAPAGDHLRLADGTIAMGALLGLADSVAGLCGGLAALPGWVVSTSLMLRAVDPRATGPLELRAGVLRAGRNAVVTAVTVHDAGGDGRLLADAALTSAVLQPEGGPPVYDRPLVLRMADAAPAHAPALAEFLAVESTGPDTIRIPITDTVRNPWGILHGAATAALVDLAARHHTGARTTSDVVLHFLRPGRVGPVVARARSLGARPDGEIVRVEITDAGAANRLMAVAIATARA
jgi:uncharacterized protein (TIGR00369 family)